MDLTEGSETSSKLNLTFFIQPLKMDLTECSETSSKLNLTFFIQPLKMYLTEGSETSAKLNLTPGKYPKENIHVFIQYFETIHTTPSFVTTRNMPYISSAYHCHQAALRQERLLRPTTIGHRDSSLLPVSVSGDSIPGPSSP
jgi:hypothetical protein